MRSRLSLMFVALALCAGASYFAERRVNAQVPSPALSYTAAQAERGAEAYAEHCASCHGPNLDDGAFAPALSGIDFRRRWAAPQPLFAAMSEKMPPARPGSLGEKTYVDLLALLLQEKQHEATLHAIGLGEIGRCRRLEDAGARAAEAAEQDFGVLLATFGFYASRNLPGPGAENTCGRLLRFASHHALGRNGHACLRRADVILRLHGWRSRIGHRPPKCAERACRMIPLAERQRQLWTRWILCRARTLEDTA